MTEDTPHVGIPEQLARRMSMPEQHEYLRAKHARPKLSRRGALAGGIAAGVAGGGGLLLGRASTATAASP
ncbi:MAG TPA: phosphoesterase, partial [Streptomyces sp.]|nr:phosphoesterase [Streptomyces sp.]